MFNQSKRLLGKIPIMVVIVLVAFVACSPAAAPSPAPAKPAAPAAPAAAPAPASAKPAEPKVVAEKPRRGGTWRVGGEVSGTPTTLDVGRRSGATPHFLLNVVSCKLVMWDARPDRVPGTQEQVIPDLAERWENSADGKVWTFHLRRGVMLPPPSNREVVAEDVKKTLERVANLLPRPQTGGDIPWMFATDPVTGRADYKKPNLEILDKYTLRITTSQVDADFLANMGGHSWALHFPDLYEPTADGWGDIQKAENLKGCGPFMGSEYVIGSRITYVRNPNYYNKELPYLDVVENRLIFEPGVAAAALRSGQLDSWGFGIVMPPSLGRGLEAAPGVQVKWELGEVAWPWDYDLDTPPFNDVRVRRALALAIDRKSMIKDLYFGRGQNVVLMQPSVSFWNLPPEKMGEAGKYFTTYDPEAAKKLLKEAGYPNGFSFEMRSSNLPMHVVGHPGLEVVQAYFDAIGVKMKLTIMDYGAFQLTDLPVGGMHQSGLWRPYLATWVYDIIHYKTSIKRNGTPKYGRTFETDPEYRRAVALMDEQKQTLDVNKRRELVHELQKVWAQNLWTFYLPVPDSPYINTTKVRGYYPVGGWSGAAWKYVWLAE